MVVGLVSMGVPKGAARHMYWYSSWSLEDVWGVGEGDMGRYWCFSIKAIHVGAS